jgi:DNA-binding IclR family transcriptional regulator
MITTAQELQVLRKLKDAEDGGVPASEIADMVELPASEVEQTLRTLVSQGLVWTAVDGSPVRQGAQVSPLYWLSEKGRAVLEE